MQSPYKRILSLQKMKNLYKLVNKCFLFSLLVLIFSCASSPNNSEKPIWVDSIDSAFSRSYFVAAVGHSSDREMAEKNAFANLASYFGQSIQSDQTIINTYQEAVKNGISAGWVDNIALRNIITTSASMDTLVGAEIREVWHDTKGNVFYAVAVMEKAKIIKLYTDMILANLDMIKNLTSMNQAEKISLEGISRYQFAATVADINISYANLLRLLGAASPNGVRRGDEYRLEAQNIARTIPVNVVVSNDRANKIQSAFAKVFSDLGFKSSTNNSRYMLRVIVTLSQVEFPNNPHRFVQMELSSNLIDTSNKEILLPYGFNNREGHTTLQELKTVCLYLQNKE